MMLTKILFFLVFTFCYCETVNLYEILFKQVKDVKLKMPPRYEYERVLFHLSVTNSRIFQGIIPFNNISAIHTKHELPKNFVNLIRKINLTEEHEKPIIIGLNFTKRLDEVTYSELVGVAYRFEDKIFLAYAEVQVLALPFSNGYYIGFEQCKRMVFFKKCKRLFIEIIKGFNEKKLNIFEQTVKAYGYKELTRIIESNKGLNIQLLD